MLPAAWRVQQHGRTTAAAETRRLGASTNAARGTAGERLRITLYLPFARLNWLSHYGSAHFG